MENPLQNEFEWYVKHQADLVREYSGKYLVIKDQGIVGAYESQLEAYRESLNLFEPGTFLIHQAQAGDSNISQTFYSRVSV